LARAQSIQEDGQGGKERRQTPLALSRVSFGVLTHKSFGIDPFGLTKLFLSGLGSATYDLFKHEIYVDNSISFFLFFQAALGLRGWRSHIVGLFANTPGCRPVR